MAYGSASSDVLVEGAARVEVSQARQAGERVTRRVPEVLFEGDRGRELPVAYREVGAHGCVGTEERVGGKPESSERLK